MRGEVFMALGLRDKCLISQEGLRNGMKITKQKKNIPVFRLFRYFRLFRNLLPFYLEQPAFAFDSPAIAAQFAILADHPVAWSNECGRVGVARSGDCPCRPGLTNTTGDFTVGRRLPYWNTATFLPDSLLKCSPLNIQRKMRVRQLSF